MNLSLSPAIERCIEEHVKSGRFDSPEQVVEAAIVGLDPSTMDGSLDGEDIAAIAEADAEFDRGDVISLEDLKAEYEAKFKELK